MLYFLRHAQSIANRDGIYAGAALDSPLSPQGIKKFSEYASTNTTEFDIIYVSELTRSYQSGHIFNNLQKKPAKILSDSRINELDFGKLTGHSYLTFDTEEMYKKYGIESKASFYQRVNDFYRDIQKAHPVGTKILIVGHSGIGKMLYAIINGFPYDTYNSLQRFDDYKIFQLK